MKKKQNMVSGVRLVYFEKAMRLGLAESEHNYNFGKTGGRIIRTTVMSRDMNMTNKRNIASKNSNFVAIGAITCLTPIAQIPRSFVAQDYRGTCESRRIERLVTGLVGMRMREKFAITIRHSRHSQVSRLRTYISAAALFVATLPFQCLDAILHQTYECIPDQLTDGQDQHHHARSISFLFHLVSASSSQLHSTQPLL
jgi:hypothetical protein